MDQIGHAIHDVQNAIGSLTAPKITEHEHEVQHKVAEHDRLEHEHEMEERRRHQQEHDQAAAGPAMNETAAGTASADKPAEVHDARGAEEQEAKQEETEATAAAPEGEGGM